LFADADLLAVSAELPDGCFWWGVDGLGAEVAAAVLVFCAFGERSLAEAVGIAACWSVLGHCFYQL